MSDIHTNILKEVSDLMWTTVPDPDRPGLQTLAIETLTPRQLTDKIVAALGEPERLNLLDGEIVSAYVVGRSRA